MKKACKNERQSFFAGFFIPKNILFFGIYRVYYTASNKNWQDLLPVGTENSPKLCLFCIKTGPQMA